MAKLLEDEVTVSGIAFAMHVKGTDGKCHHVNRAYHGLIWKTDKMSDEYYRFSTGEVFPLSPNTVIYLPEGSEYYVTDASGVPNTNRFHSACDCINFYLEGCHSGTPFSLKVRNAARFIADFDTAATEWEQKKRGYVNRTKSILYRILAALQEESESRYLPSSQIELLAPAVAALSSSYTSPDFRISSLPPLCGISEAYFRRLFKKRFGKTPAAYLTELRIEHAKDVIRGGAFLTFSDLAAKCGYGEIPYFFREFKRYTGLTPKQFHESRR